MWRKYGWATSILFGFLMPLVLVALLWLSAFSPWGLPVDAGLGPAIGGIAIGILFSLVLTVGTFVRWIVRRRGGREFAASVLFGAGCCLAFYPALFVGYTMKIAGAQYLAWRAEPVAAAIEAFTAAEGRPPKALLDIVPKYLPSLPATGSSRYPEFILLTGADAFAGNPWVLQIEMFEIYKWDVLSYCPRQNCLQIPGGGVIQMGKWVFLDE